MIWLWFFALSCIGVAVALSPLWFQRRTLGYLESAMAIYEDQLSEVARDKARGLISGEEAKAAEAEIKRRMLSAGKSAQRSSDLPQDGKALILVSVAIMVLGGFGLYSFVGQPQLPSLPFAERAEERADDAELTRLTTQLRDRLLADQNGGEAEGWMLLGQTYMRMGRYRDAVAAFATVAVRDASVAATHSQLAEAIIASENGIVTPAASTAIARTLELDPRNPAGSFYRSVELEQQGDLSSARSVLIARLRIAQTAQPWMLSFVDRANMLADALDAQPVALEDFVSVQRGPTAEDVEAAQALSPEEQAAFIASMVEGLAARLEDNPDDLEGWIQLARAYLVLGRREDARTAFMRAQTLTEALPMDDPRRNIINQGLAR